ncbi:MAG: Rne/Rng family ribonuclease [Rickettsiales bacterium]|nr:Rne/Rng family ribonuclease [Rickettsiales bacterium]
MTKLMLIDAQHADETRVVIADDDRIEDFDFVTSSKTQVKGNIYLAKITRVEPSLQAAFVEYGGGKQGFLPFSEIHPDYYQIPTEDKQRLIDEEREENEREEAEEEEELEAREKGRGRGRRRGGRGRGRHRRGRKNEEANETESEESEEATASDEGEAESKDVKALAAEQDVVASEKVEDDAQEEPEEAEASAENDNEESEAPAKAKGDADDETEEDDDEAETVSEDDVEETRRRRKGSSFKRYKIQEVIKRNQIVLVQVIKEERGNKGVSLTTYISLAGRYCVLMPNSPKAGGVSRKIGNGENRKKLKEIVAELKQKRGLSAIVRTAGIDRTKAEIKRDYEYLAKLWVQIREDTLASTAPALIYEESDIIKRSIRDLYSSDVEQVMVQGEKAYKDAKSFMRMIMPSHAPRVKQYKDAQPIFSAHGIEDQLATMYEPNAKLPSGGSIVLQQTEALISIDVNSGRSTTERNVEETAIKTNLEAAREVARQLRLRDLAGLVVIDFIDMNYGKNRRNLERAMKEALKLDRAKIQVSRISPFGLMELSRQRLRPSIAESSSHVCSHCEGSGFVKSVETVTIQVIRLLERVASTGEFSTLKISVQAEVVAHLLNERRDMIQKLEDDYDVNIIVLIDDSLLTGRYRLMKTGEDGKEVLHREDHKDKKKPRRGRRGGRGRNRRDDNDSDDDSGDDNEETSEENSEEEVREKKDKPRRGRRGGRGRNRRKDEASDESESEENESKETSDEAAEEKPKRKPRRSRKKVDDSVESADDDADDSEAQKPRRGRRGGTRRKKTEEKSDKPDEVESGSSDAEQPVVTPINASDSIAASDHQAEEKVMKNVGPQQFDEVSFEDQEDDDKPKRRGWWSRNSG